MESNITYKKKNDDDVSVKQSYTYYKYIYIFIFIQMGFVSLSITPVQNFGSSFCPRSLLLQNSILDNINSHQVRIQ